MKSPMASILVRAILAFDQAVPAAWDSGYAPAILNGCIFGTLVALLILVNNMEAEHSRAREAPIGYTAGAAVAAQRMRDARAREAPIGYTAGAAVAAQRMRDAWVLSTSAEPSVRDFICLAVLAEESE
jgi:alpha/beta superfamily hydrolase